MTKEQQEELGQNLRFAHLLRKGDVINFVTKRKKIKKVTVCTDPVQKKTKKGERVVLELATQARPTVPWTSYVEPETVFELAA